MPPDPPLTDTPTAPAAPIASPCVNICRIDADGLCVGCARTLAEITRWPTATETWRATVVASLPARRTATALRQR